MFLQRLKRRRRFSMENCNVIVFTWIFVLLTSTLSLESSTRTVYFEITRTSPKECIVEGFTLLTSGIKKRYKINDLNCLSQIKENLVSCTMIYRYKESKDFLSAYASCSSKTFDSSREIIISVGTREGCYQIGRSVEKIKVRYSPPEYTLMSRSVRFRDEDCSDGILLDCFLISKHSETYKSLVAYGRCKSIYTNEKK